MAREVLVELERRPRPPLLCIDDAELLDPTSWDVVLARVEAAATTP